MSYRGIVLRKIKSLLVCFAATTPVFAQTQKYVMSQENIYVDVATSNPQLQTINLDTVSKPLIVQNYATDSKVGVPSTDINPSFPLRDNVYYAGSINEPAMIVTNQKFSHKDFPLTIESEFFNRNSTASFDEAYIGILPSGYLLYGSLTQSPSDVRNEGIIFGFSSSAGYIYDNRSTSLGRQLKSTKNISQTFPVDWLKLNVVLDTLNKNLVLKSATLEGIELFSSYPIILGTLTAYSWLNDFRIATCADDMVSYLSVSKKLDCGIKINVDTLFLEQFLTDTPKEGTTNLKNWKFLRDNVDHGKYIPDIAGYSIDMDGSPAGNAIIETKDSFFVQPGIYTFSFYGKNNTFPNNSLLVEIGVVFQEVYPSPLNTTLFSSSFYVETPQWVKIKLTGMGPPDLGGIFIGDIKFYGGALPEKDTISFIYSDTCAGAYTRFESNNLSPDYSLMWSFGTGNVSDTSVLANPQFAYPDSGNHKVTLTAKDVCGKEINTFKNILIIKPPTIELGMDTAFCGTNVVMLNAYTPRAKKYEWNTGNNTPQVLADTSGLYKVSILDSLGCFVSDSINVRQIAYPNPNLGPDTAVCSVAPSKFAVGIDNNTNDVYLWSTNSTDAEIFISDSGLYWVEVTRENKCTARDTVYIYKSYAPPIFSLGADTLVCVETEIQLSPDIANANYLWSTGETSESVKIIIDESKTVSVEVTVFPGCSARDSIKIALGNKSNDTIFHYHVMCDYDSVVLSIEAADSYVWSTGDTTQSITIKNAGVYAYTQINTDKCSYDGVYNVNTITQTIPYIGADTIICHNDSLKLSTDLLLHKLLWSTGDTAPTTSVNTTGHHWLEVSDTLYCYSTRDSLFVEKTLPIQTENIITLLKPIPNYRDGEIAIYFNENDKNDYLLSINGIDYTKTTNTFSIPYGDQTIYIKDSLGCVTTIPFRAEDNIQFNIPNIITPNGDGVNDVFYIEELIPQCQLTIINRWGSEMFQTSNYQNNWGMGSYPNGIYYYHLYSPWLNREWKGWVEVLK